MVGTVGPASRSGVRLAGCAISVLALATVASACGSSSSGGKAINPATTLAAGLKLQQQGDLGSASELYQQVIAVQPNNIYAHFDLGVVDQARGNPVGALADYGAALTINPRYVPALYNEATIYGTSDPVLAISLYRQIVGIQPIAATAFLNLGFLEIKHGEPKQGVKDLATAISQDSTLLSRIPKHLQALVTAVAPPASSTSPAPSTPPSTPTKKNATPTSSPS